MATPSIMLSHHINKFKYECTMAFPKMKTIDLNNIIIQQQITKTNPCLQNCAWATSPNAPEMGL